MQCDNGSLPYKYKKAIYIIVRDDIIDKPSTVKVASNYGITIAVTATFNEIIVNYVTSPRSYILQY